jgi:hypothetical protein
MAWSGSINSVPPIVASSPRTQVSARSRFCVVYAKLEGQQLSYMEPNFQTLKKQVEGSEATKCKSAAWAALI